MDQLKDSDKENTSHGWEGRFAEIQLTLLKMVDSETQQHKVITTLYGEVPGAAATVLFTIFEEFSLFIVVSSTIYVIKVILLTLVRPYVVCLLADAGEPWYLIQSKNVDYVMSDRKAFAKFCPWQKLCQAALPIVHDLSEEPEECAAAVRGIANLILEVDDDSSAAMVVTYTNFLKEIHSELPPDDPHEGVTIFRRAISRALKQLCPGITKHDIQSQRTLDGGNLGYLPTGNGLHHAEGLVKEMRESSTGASNLPEMLAPYKGRYVTLPGNATKIDDLCIFYSDLEPDDCMAIAQLWQWKIEQYRMAIEPIVIFGADFSDKEKGTVFEKKRLVAQLMLGTKQQYVLTPVTDVYKEGSKRNHPLANYWESQREQELHAICERIKNFMGTRVHLYIMAPGKGNLAAILNKLKENKAWPIDEKGQIWKVGIYSGAFNMRGMTVDDNKAILEFANASGFPLLDAAKFPFFGGKHPHAWTDSFTTFAPPNFPQELNLHAHTILTAGLKMLNDEHNFGLVHPEKLYKTKELTIREKERLEKIKPKYKVETINEYCKMLQDDFALFAKMEEMKKSTVIAFAFDSCDSPLADQLIFMLEFLMEKNPELLSHKETGAWQNSAKGHTSVDFEKDPAKEVEASLAAGEAPKTCKAYQPALHHAQDEHVLTILRNKLQEYLIRHLQMLHQDDEEEDTIEHMVARTSSMHLGDGEDGVNRQKSWRGSLHGIH
jgi:hypothetical protein